MTKFERAPEFYDRGLSGGHGLPIVAAIKAAVLLACLVAYGLGFVILYPLAQESVSRSAAADVDPMAFVAP